MYSVLDAQQVPPVGPEPLPPPQAMSLIHIQSLIGETDALGHQAEDDESEVDSAYGSESLIGDDTVTLASYITDYRYEHGRRYHAYRDGSYWVSCRISLGAL